ncbi:MAG: hypothetical protein JXB85_05195 [Anaerolineales bacterium]|nr:hypothetical protein [Anaerolineales bacterium]
MTLWQHYDSTLFVDRPGIRDVILAWADAEVVDRRVISIIAPPGAGKTWLMKDLYEEWGKPEARRFAVWLNIPRFVTPHATDPDEVLDAAEIGDLIAEIETAARRHCPRLPGVDRIPDQPAIISRLVELVCECNLARAPVIIVDGYDEISPEQAAVVSLRLLDRFLDRDCTRMLIAYRDPWRLDGAARRTQRTLYLLEASPLSEDFAKTQFEQLRELACQEPQSGRYPQAQEFSFERLKTLPLEYPWNHPFINAFLFDRLLRCDPARRTLLSQQDLLDCCTAVITRPTPGGVPCYAMLEPEVFECLVDLAAGLAEEWNSADLEAAGLPNVLDPRMKKLFQYGLITDHVPYYRVGEGLRELLRDLHEMRKKKTKESSHE